MTDRATQAGPVPLYMAPHEFEPKARERHVAALEMKVREAMCDNLPVRVEIFQADESLSWICLLEDSSPGTTLLIRNLSCAE